VEPVVGGEPEVDDPDVGGVPDVDAPVGEAPDGDGDPEVVDPDGGGPVVVLPSHLTSALSALGFSMKQYSSPPFS